MSNRLPYIDIDNSLEFNVYNLLIILSILGKNRNNRPVLTFEKIQCLFYLIKNPSKINNALILNKKSLINVDSKLLYTIDSQSVNVDILYSREKLKFIIKWLAKNKYLEVAKDDDNIIYYYSSPKADDWVREISDGYFRRIVKLSESIKPLASQSQGKLIKSINDILKRVI